MKKIVVTILLLLVGLISVADEGKNQNTVYSRQTIYYLLCDHIKSLHVSEFYQELKFQQIIKKSGQQKQAATFGTQPVS